MRPTIETQFNYLNTKSIGGYNKSFNERIGITLENYFSPEEISDLKEYIFVGEMKTKLAEEFSLDSENGENIYSGIKNEYIDNLDFFSSYEKMLFSNFFHGKFKTYIISGAMGSGKTTTLNYIIEKIKETPKYHKTLIIKLDFSKGYGTSGSTIDEIVKLFHGDLYKKIKAELIEEVNYYILSTDFLKTIKNKRSYYSDFYSLYMKFLIRSNEEWELLSEMEKVDEIFQFIENETEKGSINRLYYVMYYLNYVKNYLETKENNPIIFVYDNIDKIQPAAQREIFIDILSLNAIAEIKMIFTLRRSTKAKIDKLLSKDETPLFNNRAQYPYGHIYHHGPSVLKVYKSKLQSLINDIDSMTLFSLLTEKDKECIKLRGKEIIEKIDHAPIFRQAFNGISGHSKRLALTLACRPFCNNIINFDALSNNLQSLVRTLYAGDGEKMRIALNDNFVCNIYSDNKNKFTLLNYFILFVLNEYSSSEKLFYLRRVDNLYDFLNNYLGYSSKEIVDALNYLLSDKRALIGGEYLPFYRTLDDLIRQKDLLRITELGDRYYNSLLKHGSIYNQVCLLSVKWKGLNESEYESDSIAERFSDLRLCIANIKDEEDFRFSTLKRSSIVYKKEIQISPISENLINLFSNSLNSIVPTLDLRDSLKLEISKWRDLKEFIGYKNRKKK